jgi:hypothetical protein
LAPANGRAILFALPLAVLVAGFALSLGQAELSPALVYALAPILN